MTWTLRQWIVRLRPMFCVPGSDRQKRATILAWARYDSFSFGFWSYCLCAVVCWLAYVVVHELVHLLEPTHNGRFLALMDHFMPEWRGRRAVLNQLPVRHEHWGYRTR